MVSDTVIVNGAALDNAANLQEDEFSTNEFVHSARKLGHAVVEAPASVAGDDGAMLLRLWAV